MSRAVNFGGGMLTGPRVGESSRPGVYAALQAAARSALARREVRVVAMLAAVWVLSLFDYVHTVQGLRSGLVDECNPLADWIAGHGPTALLAFKATLVTFASLGMYRCRRLVLTEVMLGLVIAALAVVMLRWAVAYELYELAQGLAPPGYPLFP